MTAEPAARFRMMEAESSGLGDELEAAKLRAAELEALVELQREQLRQKSELLQEVNHRAKNNLQMAMALLSMQALASTDPEVADALQAASRRLGYLAKVHELLYRRGDDLQMIDVADLLRDVALTLQSAFDRNDVQVSVEAEPLMLGVDQAVNAALIVGEAILNSYKYAFPGGRAGHVCVSLKVRGRAGMLQISDNGIGFSAEERRGSLGMRLLRALGRALGGEAMVDGTAGTKVSVEFPILPQPEARS